jgi:hypothetical protein
MASELKLLVAELRIEKDLAIALYGAGTFLYHDFDVNPEDFVEQAEEDYEHGGNAALLNAITNAKRAIRSQVDRVIYCLGYEAKSMRIVRKMELLRELEIVAPRILRKVDDARNLLEHEYKSPSIQDVEDAIDLAALFVEATNRSIDPVGCEFSIGNEDEYIQGSDYYFLNELFFVFEPEEKRFRISGVHNTPEENQVLGLKRIPLRTIYVSSNDPMYLPTLRIAITYGKNWKHRTETAVEKFFDALEQAA